MKPIKKRAAVPSPAARARWALWLLLSLLLAPMVQAESVLLSDTSLVSGSQSEVFSFQAPGPGILSIQLTDVDWPQTLSSLSFMAGTGSQVLTSWSDTGSQSRANLSFQITGGHYFADVLASAGGTLDLGVYSLSIQFTPTSPVPLPASGVLLLTGLVAIIVVRRAAHAKRAAL
jgi:hypothetical protein